MTEQIIKKCDNLELLNELPNNHIDLIYCDILYGTGKDFKDYKDLKCDRNIIEGHYIPRLKEMHRVLKDTGSIYLQMDYRINHWIRIIMDDIFGYGNFIDQIIWKKSSTGKGNKTNKQVISNDYDTILIFGKTNIVKYNFNKIDKPIDTLYLKEYKYFCDIENKYFKIVPLGMYSKLSIENMRKNNEIYISKSGKEYKKYYLDDIVKGAVSNIWTNCYDLYQGNNKEMLNYSTQKPKSLLERIITISSNENDLVADFYLGSGTTAVVCKELNRNFIGCDINPNAVEITNKRLMELKK